MKRFRILPALFIIISIVACTNKTPQKYSALNELIKYSGRYEKLEQEVVLIGSASSAEFRFEGDSCIVMLRNYSPNQLHNYFSLELDGEDLGRFRIEGEEMLEFTVPVVYVDNDEHVLRVFKSTEASNGYINVGGILCKTLLEPDNRQRKCIEFIGNSITCGMGNDFTGIACGSGQWYDQHNAYWAYGPTVSRALDVEFLLSSVSGIGIYRNWNGEGPVMPKVYENLYLDLNTSKKRDFSTFDPDIVSIALGTNDFSEGDGIKERLPFDAEMFVNEYIAFVQIVLDKYPQTQIALLSSPMVGGQNNELFIDCLNKVKMHFDAMDQYKPFAVFEFEPMTPAGCDYHPSIDDHLLMADQLFPFYDNLLK